MAKQMVSDRMKNGSSYERLGKAGPGVCGWQGG